MPLFEYKCPRCEHTTERLEKFDANEEVVCSKCGVMMRRTMAVSAFRLYGDGVYHPSSRT